MKRNKGFTLVELMIVMSIIVIMAIIAVSIINPTSLVGRANDAKRKSDLNKIKRGFEEYYNDKGLYPVSGSWNTESNCGKKIINSETDIGKYITSWPCDPKGGVYEIVSTGKYFIVLANLDNKSDKDIPDGWYDSNFKLTDGVNRDTANYGVSSPNVVWYERNYTGCDYNPNTFIAFNCYQLTSSGCKGPMNYCVGSNCYTVSNCNDDCKVTKCCAAGNVCRW